MDHLRSGVLRLGIGLLLALVLAACTLPSTGDNTDSETALSGLPVVEIAAPLPNASYLEGVPVVIQAAVSNAGADINRVEFAIDGNTIATQPEPNTAGAPIFSVMQTWTAEDIGSHTITVVAFRADGSSSAPANVTINVVDPAPPPTDIPPTPTTVPAQSGGSSGSNGDSGGSDDSADAEPTDDAATNTPEPEPTSNDPIARTTSGINVRRGPSTAFEPPVGSLAPNTAVDIIAINPAGDWLRVRGIGGEGWIFAALTEIEGNVDSVPVESGPPLPTAVPPTPIPPTPAPQLANLTVTQPYLNPPVPQCGQVSRFGMTIQNSGSTATTTGLSRIELVRKTDGQVFQTSGGQLVAVTLEPGGTHTVEVQFTIDVFVNETHTVRFIADANGQVNETNESDNSISVDYPFGACP